MYMQLQLWTYNRYIKYIYVQHATMCSEMHTCKHCYVLLYSADLQRGDFWFRQCENLSVTAWQDIKVVFTMATNMSPTVTTSVQEGKGWRTRDVPCPLSITLYNQHMGGVDRGDQLQEYYPIRSKCLLPVLQMIYI